MARTALCLVEQTPQRSSCREAEKTLQLPPSPAPGSWSSLLDAQPCCFSPSLYSDSEFPNPDGPSPSTKDIRGAQVSAPSLCVCVWGGEWPTQASPALTLRSLGSLNLFF